MSTLLVLTDCRSVFDVSYQLVKIVLHSSFHRIRAFGETLMDKVTSELNGTYLALVGWPLLLISARAEWRVRVSKG